MDGEDLNEIFADYEAIRGDGNSGDVNNEQTDANEIESSQAAAAAVRKRIVRNPRPKLNADRLCGERGIPSLEKHFENIFFVQDKGHEKENLDKLLGHLEHWTHRLFPSLKFSESLAHIEKLGKKKPVQVCVKKLRLDMPILAEDFVHDGGDDMDDNQQHLDMDVSDPPESAFDQLMREHRETFPETADVKEDAIVAPYSSYNPPLSPSRPSTTPLSPPRPAISPQSPPRSTAEKEELTEEQKQRIERNKMLAAERRKARLAAMSTSVTLDVSHGVSNSPEDSSNVHEAVPDANSEDVQNLSALISDELSARDFEFSVA